MNRTKFYFIDQLQNEMYNVTDEILIMKSQTNKNTKHKKIYAQFSDEMVMPTVIMNLMQLC